MTRREIVQLRAAKAVKVEEIDKATSKKIVALIGNENRQRNALALYSKLQRKEADDSISDEEKAILDGLEAQYDAVEQYIAEGNKLEASVMAMETLDEVEAVEV